MMENCVPLLKLLVIIPGTAGVSHTFIRNHFLYLLEIT